MSPRGVIPRSDHVDLSYVDVEDFLTALGIDVAYVSHGNAGFKCPFHNDRHPSARMSTETTAWLCAGCGERGNAITFLVMIRSIEYTVAHRLIEERYGGSLRAPIGALVDEVRRILFPDEKDIEERVRPSEQWIARFHVDWNSDLNPYVSYMIDDRGFDIDALTRWQIGYDDISDRVTIPVRDVDGTLVGFKGRAHRSGHEPKYLVIGDARLDDPERPPRYEFQTYRKSEYVFGLDRARDQADVVIVEGELNAIALEQHGVSDAVSVAGSEFSERQQRLIIERSRSVTIYFDDDDAGRKGTTKVAEALSPFLSVRVVVGAPGDAADLDRDSVLALLAGARPWLLVVVGATTMRDDPSVIS